MHLVGLVHYHSVLSFICFNYCSLCDIQIFGSIGSVGGGLALGKEGPLVHTGACIASLLGQVSGCCLELSFYLGSS